MADKDPPINMSSDRARRINSLHQKVEGVVHEQNKRRLQISNEVSSLTKEQQRLMQQLDMERSEFTNDTAAAYNGVVKSLGKAIQNLSVGVKNITTDTAKATSAAIGQYGKAIGEDISINKQNTMAMALSKATPLFGYFAAKFMETDVFQSAARNMKESVSGTLAKAGESLGNVFKRNKELQAEGELPKMQEGGFVKKGGVVEVHAAEVVTPIDKIMKRIDDVKTEDISKRLSVVLDTLSQNLVRMETLVGEIHQDRKDIFGTFIQEFQKTRMYKEKPWQDRLLKAVLELKVAMIGTASRFRIAFQRTLLQHPTFRAMLMFSQTLQSVITSPFKALFGLRGGFAGDVKRATSTSNIYAQQVNMLALIYMKGMTYLRNIEKYTKVSAEALVGQEVSPTSGKHYTLFGKIKEFMTTRSFGKTDLFGTFVDNLGLDRAALDEAGIHSFNDLLNPAAILRNMGITKENIRGRFGGEVGGEDYVTAAQEAAWNAKFDAEFAARGMAKRAKRGYERGMTAAGEFSDAAVRSTKTFAGKVVSHLKEISKAERDREDREGPHSPSMAENVATTATFQKKAFGLYKKLARNVRYIWANAKRTAKLTKANFKKQYKSEMERQKKIAEMAKDARKTANTTEKAAKAADKTRKDIKGWIPMLLGWLTTIGGRLRGLLMSFGKLGSWLVTGPIGKVFGVLGKGIGGIAKFFGRGGKKLTIGAGGRMGKLLGGARGALAGGGVRGLLGWGARGLAGAGGAVLAGTAGLAIGGGMGLWDMVSAMMSGDAEGYVQNWLMRGIAGFLGGTKSGATGAKRGALKGGLIGAGLGAFGGPIGIAIGGAAGAIAGGLLGFVGGADISQAIKKQWEGVKDLIGGLWKVVKFPFDIMQEAIKSIWILVKWAGKNIYKKIDEWMEGSSILGPIWRGMKGVISTIWDGIKSIGDWVKQTISSVFGGDDWKKTLKQAIVDFFFPIPNLIRGFKEIGLIIDEWLSNLPWGIGFIYRKAKKYAKKISGGTLARDLAGSLGEANVYERSAISLDYEGALANQYAKEELNRNASRERAAMLAAEANRRAIESQTKAYGAQINNSTNTIVSSNSQVNNVAPGERKGFKMTNPTLDRLARGTYQ